MERHDWQYCKNNVKIFFSIKKANVPGTNSPKAPWEPTRGVQGAKPPGGHETNETPPYGCVYFVPVIEGSAARREHNSPKLVCIGEMLLFFVKDELCSRRAAPATKSAKKKYKGLSYSNREGIDEKWKYKQKQYKMKVLKKSDKLCILGL